MQLIKSVNLIIRFILELIVLFAFAALGKTQFSGVSSIAAAVVFPVIAAIAWGVFAVPGDPSRSGNAPIPIPGILRLALEFLIFILAIRALQVSDMQSFAMGFGIIVLVHYMISFDRILWLILHSSKNSS